MSKHTLALYESASRFKGHLGAARLIYSTQLPFPLSGPLSCYTPHQVKDDYELAYRAAFGIAPGGGLCLSQGDASHTVELAKDWFQTRARVMMSIFRLGEDGVARQDSSTIQEVIFILENDYRKPLENLD